MLAIAVLTAGLLRAVMENRAPARRAAATTSCRPSHRGRRTPSRPAARPDHHRAARQLRPPSRPPARRRPAGGRPARSASSPSGAGSRRSPAPPVVDRHVIPYLGHHTIPYLPVTLVLSDPGWGCQGWGVDDVANLAGKVVGRGLAEANSEDGLVGAAPQPEVSFGDETRAALTATRPRRWWVAGWAGSCGRAWARGRRR